MSPDVSRPAAESPPPAGPRLAVRMGLLLLLATAWLLPWAEVQSAASGAPERELGAARTGMPALAALVVLWGLALTALSARTRRGLMAGEAFTAAALAAAVAALLLVSHPWIPGSEKPALLLPIFLPLAALALLDGLTRLRAAATGAEITVVRAAAGLFAAGALVSDGQWLPAGLAAWIAGAPLVFLGGRSGRAARLGVEGLSAAAAFAAGLAPAVHARLAAVREPIGGVPMLTAYAWYLLAAVVVLTGVMAFFDAREVPVPGPAR